jgi:hypothetical protein
MLKHSQERQKESGCDNKSSMKDSDSKSSELNESESESESEIDLTTTSPKSFTLVNGCIDFSNNNNCEK